MVESNVYVFESNKTNAFCSKIVGGYVIALSSGMFGEFHTELCIYFDKVYYDSESIDLTLIVFAYTKRGMDYLEGLHNEWNKVRKKLE